MKRTSIFTFLTLVLAFFLATSQSTAQTESNSVTVSACSVSPTDLDYFIPNKDGSGNYNLVDPKPNLRVVFSKCAQVEYATSRVYNPPSDDSEQAPETLDKITEAWLAGGYPKFVKLGLHEYCYITYVDQNSVTQRVSLAIDNPEIDEEADHVVFKFITSDLQYIPSNTVFQLHVPEFKCFTETEINEEKNYGIDVLNDDDQGSSKAELEVTYENSSSIELGDTYGGSEAKEIIFEFKTKNCNVVDGSSANYNDSSTEWVEDLPAIVYNHADYIITDTRKCSQLIVEPGSGIRIKSGATLTVVDTAYFIGPDTYDLTLRPYLINYGTFDNDNSSEVKENESEEVVGRTIFTQTLAMTSNDCFYRKVRFALPIEKCIASSMSTFFDEGINFQIREELFESNSTAGAQVTLKSHGVNVNATTILTYDMMNLISRASSPYDIEYNRKAILRLNGKINDEDKYSFDNKSKFSYSSDEYRLICARHSANNVLQAPLDMRRIYEDERTDAYSMWISYGKNFDCFAYNCISGITTFDGDMRKGYLLPQMSYFFADHNTNYDYSGADGTELKIHFEYDKDDLKTYDDIVKEYKKDGNNEINVDYKYYRFYVEEKNPESPDFGNRYVFAVYFMPKSDYDSYVAPYRLGQTANGMPNGSNVTDGHLNPVYECMIDCDGNYLYDGTYTSNTTKYFHFPVITASSYNGYDVAGIYREDYGDGAGYYDYQRGLIIKCLPVPVPCNVSDSDKPHDHSETIKNTVTVTDDGDFVTDEEGNEITEEVDTGVKVCSYQALDLPLIIRANDITSIVELGILDTNITEEDGITLADAETYAENVNISETILSGGTYTIEFDENSKTQIFLNHSDSLGSGHSVLVPYTIIKLKVVPYPEYSSEDVMPDDPDAGGSPTDSEDLNENTSGSAGNEEDGNEDEGTGGSGSGSGGTTPTTPNTPEAISNVQTSTLSVVAKQSAVEVRGTQPGAVCAIYDLTGAQVAQKTSTGSAVTLQVPKAGIYFIAVAQENTTKTFKTIVK